MTQDYSWQISMGSINGQKGKMVSQVDKNGKVLKTDIYIDFNNDGINDLKVFQQGGKTSVFTAAARDGKSSWDEAPSEFDIYKELDFKPIISKKAEPAEAKTNSVPRQTQSKVITPTPAANPAVQKEEVATNNQADVLTANTQEKPESEQIQHTVAPKETLGSIAKKYGCTVNELVKLNNIKNKNKIDIGQTIKIPTSKKTETQQSEVQLVATKGNQEDFLDALAFSESSGRYNAKKGQYLGRYQLGRQALKEIGYMDSNGNFTAKSGVKNAQEFLNSPEAQEKAMALYSKKQWSYIEKIAKEYEGKKINGIQLTRSGMLAAAHLVGPGGLKRYIRSGGKDIPKDGNKTSIETYLKKFANYDVSGFTKNSRIAKN